MSEMRPAIRCSTWFGALACVCCLGLSPCAGATGVAVLAFESRNLTPIADLAAHSAEVKFGGPSEFLNRAEGLPGLKKIYGLDIPEKNFVAISDGGGPATVRALADGTVTAADLFSTSPAIPQNNFVVLADPKNNFPAANVVPVVSSQKKSTELKRVLDAVSAKLTTDDLIALNGAVSGNSGIEDKVRGLGVGADDYMTKPFHKDELVARIHAIVRRSKGHAQSVIQTGGLKVNLDTKTVDVNGQRVHLTGKEYQMLELLSLRKGTTLTKEMFLNHLYGGMDEPELKIIDVFICKLRKKLAAATGGKHYIETVWGRGYVLRNPEDEADTGEAAA